jgi:hypothetical protein
MVLPLIKKWYSNCHYIVQKSPSLNHVLSYMNPNHTITQIFKIEFNIIPPLTKRSSYWESDINNLIGYTNWMKKSLYNTTIRATKRVMTYLLSYLLTHILIVTQQNSHYAVFQHNAKGIQPAEFVRMLAPEKHHPCTRKEAAYKTHAVTQNLNTGNKIFLTRFTCPFIKQVGLYLSLCLLRDV